MFTKLANKNTMRTLKRHLKFVALEIVIDFFLLKLIIHSWEIQIVQRLHPRNNLLTNIDFEIYFTSYTDVRKRINPLQNS